MDQREILKYAGNLAQVAGITEKTFTRGKARGIASYEVKTGSGLEYTLLPDKCLDIYELRYKGRNISFLAKNGLVGSGYGYPLENEFDAYWTAGMLCTCGLMNIGTDCREGDGRYHPLHGRIGMTPAEQSAARAYWEADRYLLEASAVMRESVMGRENLRLCRRVLSSLESSDIEIEDIVTNDDASSVEYMLLYHFNFGYPFLAESTKMLFPKGNSAVEARTESAKQGLATWDKIGKPVDGKTEEVFFHHPESGADGLVTVRLENGGLGIGVALKYESASLPVLTQWKSFRSGEYALGIEPGTSRLRGRLAERAEGGLCRLEPFASHKRRLTLSFYDL
jgi:hypothetical protein